MTLDALLQRAGVWRGGEASLRARHRPAQSIPTGLAPLDEQLPGGGWPLGWLSELLLPCYGIGELQLLLPVLAQLSRQERRIVFVAPPYIPYAPALWQQGVRLSHVLLIHTHKSQQQLWAMEQALRAGVCGAVLGWTHAPDPRVLRRLQLAAEAGQSAAILFRPTEAARHASPAGLRIELTPAVNGTTVHIRKRRGGWHYRPVRLRPAPSRRHAVA